MPSYSDNSKSVSHLSFKNKYDSAVRLGSSRTLHSIAQPR